MNPTSWKKRGLRFVFAVGLFSVVFTAPVFAEGKWRRTVRGWESVEGWQTQESAAPVIHPLVFASLQGLLSTAALLTFNWDGERLPFANRPVRIRWGV